MQILRKILEFELIETKKKKKKKKPMFWCYSCNHSTIDKYNGFLYRAITMNGLADCLVDFKDPSCC